MIIQKCSEKESKSESVDGYEVFFFALFIFGFLFPILGIIGIDFIHDDVHNSSSILGKIIMYLVLTIGATAIFTFQTEETSAKVMFWFWIGFSVLVAAGCFIGVGEIWLFKQIFL